MRIPKAPGTLVMNQEALTIPTMIQDIPTPVTILQLLTPMLFTRTQELLIIPKIIPGTLNVLKARKKAVDILLRTHKAASLTRMMFPQKMLTTNGRCKQPLRPAVTTILNKLARLQQVLMVC